MILPSRIDSAEPAGTGASLTIVTPPSLAVTVIDDAVMLAKLQPSSTDVVAAGTV